MVSPRVNQVWEYLAGMPSGSATLTTEQADELLIGAGGWIAARGEHYDVVVEPLSAGVARVSLKKRVYA